MIFSIGSVNICVRKLTGALQLEHSRLCIIFGSLSMAKDSFPSAEEYQEEVSDPAHRAETEAYLTQCEAEQRAEKKARTLHGPSTTHHASVVSLTGPH